MILLAVLAALLGFYCYLKNATQSRREVAVTSAPIAEVNAEIATNNVSKIVSRVVRPDLDEGGPIGEEPTEPPSFEDLPKDIQEKYMTDRNATIARTYANRFKMTKEEWDALSKKEQRLLIRKGAKQ